jgi:hypothetical protein
MQETLAQSESAVAVLRFCVKGYGRSHSQADARGAHGTPARIRRRSDVKDTDRHSGLETVGNNPIGRFATSQPEGASVS